MKCIQCGNTLGAQRIYVGCDGDAVCGDICKTERQEEMEAVCAMSDSEFLAWMGVVE